ncbi:hypothetical protein [Nostoc sp. DSM 114161]|uniref:hypothetical protein n=1 Tax=Nostoc sp. DSM 114161 TaxID=3440143 RepID=UPI0040456DC0
MKADFNLNAYTSCHPNVVFPHDLDIQKRDRPCWFRLLKHPLSKEVAKNRQMKS